MTQNDITRRRLLGVAGGAVAVGTVGGSTAAETGRSAIERPDGAVRTQDERYTDIYEETIDSVVLVNVFGGDEVPGGLGSGFVIDDGHVVTNDHVAGDASEVELQFRDEQWRSASVVGSDVHSDLAVLEVDDLPDAAVGLSFSDAEPTVGQEVLALGNPLGLDASISQGLVSGVDRSLPSPTGFSIPAAIQTDAPVNPGNSGGPLVSLESDVLGVVFAGAGQTIGFAISAALANRVVPALIDDGEYQHAYVGVSVLPVGPLVAEANDLEDPRGVLIVDVIPDSPADGVLEPADGVESIDGGPVPVGGDVIIAIGDREIPNQERLSSTLALETSPGETVDVEVVRDGERETVELTLEPRPDVDVP
ncbi:S1C family serine protease [Natronococcus wangiae]|uniref:S1C family serine protease n=1 Tax=Natronococcus wangiae TaxID=3068275 RepID=UPI00273E1798|nr:trypsin-like peptidase domain-containing protein [Natronococcus sp. AD5]